MIYLYFIDPFHNLHLKGISHASFNNYLSPQILEKFFLKCTFTPTSTASGERGNLSMKTKNPHRTVSTSKIRVELVVSMKILFL